jgi:hypothetical protein
VIEAIAIAAIGLVAMTLGFGFWQAKRAADAADGHLAAVKESAEAAIRLEAKERHVADLERVARDRDAALEKEIAEGKRLGAALNTVIAQRDALLTSRKDPHEAVSDVRDALGGVRHDVAGAKVPGPAGPASPGR